MLLQGKRVLVTGGTGSLGQALVRRILTGEFGEPESITVLSRDEGKQHNMRVSYLRAQGSSPTDEIIYTNFERMLSFVIGDVRDYQSVLSAVRRADVVFHAAAQKQVPTCEYFPYEAVRTNIEGPHNVVHAICNHDTPVEWVVGISTDKAAKPVNVMGMTKAIQERVFVEGNLRSTQTRFAACRYGNVVASRGSVVPLFQSQIANGGPVTITTTDMTRFLLTLDQAVDTIIAAATYARRGETYVPMAPAARMIDLAEVMIGDSGVDMVVTGIRPGEKIHEIMVSDEERYRTIRRDNYYVIRPMLPELRDDQELEPALAGEYSSEEITLDHDGLRTLLAPYLKHQLIAR